MIDVVERHRENAMFKHDREDFLAMTDRMTTYALLVSYEPDGSDYSMYGPFCSIQEASTYAEDFRRDNDLPVEATPENNDQWTNDGWYFGIQELTK